MRSSLFAVLLLTAITYTPAYADDTDGHNYVNGLCTANHDCSARYDKSQATTPPSQDDDKVYQLNSPQDFFYWAALVRESESTCSLKAKLNVDVDLSVLWKNSYTKTSWVPIGTSTTNNDFSGTFDGGGHSIKNLYINNSSLSYVGLFSQLKNAAISNLYVKAITVSGRTTTSTGGVFAATASDTKFTNCYTYNSAVSTNCTTFGGIVGSIQNGTIENCYNLASIGCKPQQQGRLVTIGGIVGISNPAALNHCFSQGKINIVPVYSGTGTKYIVYAGGIAGSAGTEATFNRCYASGNIYPPAATTVSSKQIGIFAGHTLVSSYPECYGRLNTESSATSTLVGYSSSTISDLTMLRPSSSNNTDYAYDYTIFGSSVLCDDEGGIHNEFIFDTDGSSYIDNVVYYDAEEDAYKVKNLVLTDGTPYKAEHDYTAESFSFNRSITKGNTISMVLPVTVNGTPDGCPLYKLSEIDTEDSTLVFKSATTITANCPYLVVKPTTEELYLTASNVANNCNGELTNAVSNGSITVTHTGTYLPQTYTADDTYTYYGYKDGKFIKAKKSELKPFRTMLQYTSTDASTAPLAFKVSLDGETTGIISPTLETRTVDVYDLNGRQLRSAVNSATALRGLPRGIYIVGGQKVVKQ